MNIIIQLAALPSHLQVPRDIRASPSLGVFKRKTENIPVLF